MPEGTIEKAVSLDRDGRTEEAIAFLEKIGDEWLMNYQAYLLLGKFHLKALNYGKAETYFEKGKSFMPYDECPVDIILGIIYEANDNHRKAIESWDSCLLYAFRDRAIIEMATKHLEHLKERIKKADKSSQHQALSPTNDKGSVEPIDLKIQRIFKALLQNHGNVKLLESENRSSPSFNVKPSDYVLALSSIELVNAEQVLFKKSGQNSFEPNDADVPLKTLSVSFSSITIAVRLFEADATKMIWEDTTNCEPMDTIRHERRGKDL